MKKKYTFVIINYNGFTDTYECLRSVCKIKSDNYSIIVFDNNSTDRKLEEENVSKQLHKLSDKVVISNYDEINNISTSKKIFEYNIQWIWSDSNLGFAPSCNKVMKYCIDNSISEYFILLNNDTVVNSNLLEEVDKSIITLNENFGLLGCVINYYNKKDSIWYSGGQFQWYYEGIHLTNPITEISNYSFISGCFMCIPKSTIDTIGYMNESFFLYGEDSEYSMRSLKAGLKNYVIPKTLVYHKIGQSTGGDFSPITYYYGNRNRLLLHYLHYPQFDFKIFMLLFLLMRVIRLIQFSFSGKLWLSKIMIRGIYDFIKMEKANLPKYPKWNSFSFLKAE